MTEGRLIIATLYSLKMIVTSKKTLPAERGQFQAGHPETAPPSWQGSCSSYSPSISHVCRNRDKVKVSSPYETEVRRYWIRESCCEYPLVVHHLPHGIQTFRSPAGLGKRDHWYEEIISLRHCCSRRGLTLLTPPPLYKVGSKPDRRADIPNP